jgi:glycine betaine/proline transport system ATP-binding protein
MTVEESSLDGGDGIMERTIIECQNVWKVHSRDAEAIAPEIHAPGLSKSQVLEAYGCVVGIADISFAVKAGEIVCMMGLSGSGKSNLIRHLNRLVEPTAGVIRVLDRNVLATSEAELRAFRAESVGMVFQHMAFLHITVRNKVAFYLVVQGVAKLGQWEGALRALSLVDLAGYGDRLPSELSRGMQRRVGLARALVSDPEILLMDEPLSALDPSIRRKLPDEFLLLVKKIELFITHDLAEAITLGDRIAIKMDGRVIQIGTPEEIVLSPADRYVADFASGLPRLGLISARSIMLSAYKPRQDEKVHEMKRVGDNNTLRELIDISTTTESRLIVSDGSGNDIGVATKERLLMSIKGNA